MSLHAIGYVISLSGLVGILISLALKYLRRYDFRRVLAVGVFVKMGILVAAVFLIPPYYMLGVAFFTIAQSSRSLEGPLLNPFIQNHTPSKLRATVVSVKSMVIKLALGLGGMALGKLADVIGNQQVIPLVSLFGFGAIWVLSRIQLEPKTVSVVAPLAEQM